MGRREVTQEFAIIPLPIVDDLGMLPATTSSSRLKRSRRISFCNRQAGVLSAVENHSVLAGPARTSVALASRQSLAPRRSEPQ